MTDPDWYLDAVIYEVQLRSFCDSDGDGIGDLPGLISKLDYLQELGVTAVWLLPFYPSPLRDDGYDISSYTEVHPDLGTLDDFRTLLAEAHRRGLKVITELVLNHTSDQHPWFQRARRAAPDSDERAWYVWSDTPDRYAGVRIIFQDFEPSNWTWDEEAKAYFWHRFFRTQPDLNFEHPPVREAVLEALDFWLDLGVDGLRLDAVPYLFQREGTSCENLPETHAFLRELRAHVDARHPGRMLLAEANMWPEDAVAYLGAGDECHMNFHFPLMPRLYLALARGDRTPLVDILEQTPPLPPGCQWATFLRNHDELTLEMVTDEERAEMRAAFAPEPEQRINLGIRRRLAPLCGGDQARIQLLTALLLSLPGTPVLYYGDEIGMGDDVSLPDRDGVRTPMQWSPGPNAGFSTADPQRLRLPPVSDPRYHYAARNVELQCGDPASLLEQTRRLLAARRAEPAFGRGALRLLEPGNRAVVALVRHHAGRSVLAVLNLSDRVQPVELELDGLEGLVPYDLLGGPHPRTDDDSFPRVEPEPYRLTLGPHGFYWLGLGAPSTPQAANDPPVDERAPWSPAEARSHGQRLAGAPASDEPLATVHTRREAYQTARNLLLTLLNQLADRESALTPTARALSRELRARRWDLLARLTPLRERPLDQPTAPASLLDLTRALHEQRLAGADEGTCRALIEAYREAGGPGDETAIEAFAFERGLRALARDLEQHGPDPRRLTVLLGEQS
jgi:maltose alpha-D-glucosyltransferase / alpha-amylase